MNSAISHGFTYPQAQILTVWLHSQNKPFCHPSLPQIFASQASTERLLDLLGLKQNICYEPAVVSELDVAVARILLRDVADKLPQWSCLKDNQETLLARDNTWKEEVLRPVAIIPLPLFEINWATSGPGFDWPEAYYACPVPGFDIMIVTASADSPDKLGCTDYALGWFPNGEDVVIESGKIIRNWWSYQHLEWNQPSWECLYSNRVISEGEALSWRDVVWPEYEED